MDIIFDLIYTYFYYTQINYILCQMDNKWLETFWKIVSRNQDRYLNLLPSSSEHDKVNEVVWWIKNNVPSIRKLSFFAISNIKNDRKLITNWYIVENFWPRFVKKITKNNWFAFEYFLVDYLRRETEHVFRFKNQKFNLSHIKWTPEQDDIEKIDFLTRLNTNYQQKSEKLTIWVQLTTAKSRAKFSRKTINWLDWIWNKKTDIRNSSQRIDLWQIGNYPRSFIPDCMCLFVVNWKINHFLNNLNINILKTAFNTWSQEWFISWWPTQYLNAKLREEFKLVSDWYMLWLAKFYRIIKSIDEDTETFKNMNEYENYFIITEYNHDTKELKFDFFLKNESKELGLNEERKLLMSLYFILNEKLLSKIGL